MPEFHPFEIERLMARWEHEVEFNFTESGVHPVPLRELLPDSCALRELLDMELGYPQTNGPLPLRRNIASLYQDVSPDNTLVTVGAIEANGITLDAMLDTGDEVAFMLPNYMQIQGMAANRGLKVAAFRLREDAGHWRLDEDELRNAVTPRTKLIAITNPNNPTGHILREDEIAALVREAERVGAWILTDEVYSGTERLAEVQTPSLWGRYDKVLAIGSLSKAYGLPGLRTGWVVGPVEAIEEIWKRHDYATIAGGKIANHLATAALSPELRPKLIERTRRLVREGFPLVDDWLLQQGDYFGRSESEAGAFAFVRCHVDDDAERFIHRLREAESVLLVPGSHFGCDGYVRLSTGLEARHLRNGLDRIARFVRERS